MNSRTPLIRVLGVLWATLQLASPGLSAIADGNVARETSTGSASHVEATSSTRCPVIHAPDCGVCRFLSQAPSRQANTSILVFSAGVAQTPSVSQGFALSVATSLPRGRAPPVT